VHFFFTKIFNMRCVTFSFWLLRGQNWPPKRKKKPPIQEIERWPTILWSLLFSLFLGCHMLWKWFAYYSYYFMGRNLCILYFVSHYDCHNSSFELVINTRAYKSASQEWSLQITFHGPENLGKCEGMNPHTPNGLPKF